MPRSEVQAFPSKETLDQRFSDIETHFEARETKFMDLDATTTLIKQVTATHSRVLSNERDVSSYFYATFKKSIRTKSVMSLASRTRSSQRLWSHSASPIAYQKVLTRLLAGLMSSRIWTHGALMKMSKLPRVSKI